MFWGDGNDLFLEHGGGYMDMHVFRDSSNCTLKVALSEKQSVCKRGEAHVLGLLVGSRGGVSQPEGGLGDPRRWGSAWGLQVDVCERSVNMKVRTLSFFVGT